MSSIESTSGNDDRDANWGFLEDMASIDRLDMILGETEDPTPEEPQPDIAPEQG